MLGHEPNQTPPRVLGFTSRARALPLGKGPNLVKVGVLSLALSGAA